MKVSYLVDDLFTDIHQTNFFYTATYLLGGLTLVLKWIFPIVIGP